jgi:hypothetical protein
MPVFLQQRLYLPSLTVKYPYRIFCKEAFSFFVFSHAMFLVVVAFPQATVATHGDEFFIM